MRTKNNYSKDSWTNKAELKLWMNGGFNKRLVGKAMRWGSGRCNLIAHASDEQGVGRRKRLLSLEGINVEQGGCPLLLLALRNMRWERKEKQLWFHLKRSSFLRGQLSFNKNTDVKGTIREETKNLNKLTDYGFRVQKGKVVGF